MEQFGYTDTEENIRRYARVTVDNALRHYAPMCGCTPEQLKYWYRKLVYSISDRVQVYPELPQLLREITLAGGRNHICSNRTAACCRAYLERDGLAQYFDVFSGPDVEEGLRFKPEPDLVNVVLKARGIAPSELLMVGDRILDLQAAHAAGSPACFFDPDHFIETPFETEYVAPTAEDLRRIIFDGTDLSPDA